MSAALSAPRYFRRDSCTIPATSRRNLQPTSRKWPNASITICAPLRRSKLPVKSSRSSSERSQDDFKPTNCCGTPNQTTKTRDGLNPFVTRVSFTYSELTKTASDSSQSAITFLQKEEWGSKSKRLRNFAYESVR